MLRYTIDGKTVPLTEISDQDLEMFKDQALLNSQSAAAAGKDTEAAKYNNEFNILSNEQRRRQSGNRWILLGVGALAVFLLLRK